jgi:hypothetical protein
MAVEECGDPARSVADGDTLDLHAPPLQFLEHRSFSDTRHAPACEQVQQARLAGREVSRTQRRNIWRSLRQFERRDRPVDQLGANGRIVGRDQAPRECYQDPDQ